MINWLKKIVCGWCCPEKVHEETVEPLELPQENELTYTCPTCKRRRFKNKTKGTK